MKKTKMRKKAKNSLLISKGHKPKKGKVFACPTCGKEFYKSACFVRDYKIMHCSSKCYIERLKKEAFHKDCAVCGKTFYCQPCQIKYRHRNTCSLKCRGTLMTLKAREKHKTGIFSKHQIDRNLRYCKEAEDWRKLVFARDDYTCQECGIRGSYLEAHHIKPFAYFPELRFDINNGLTLCRCCHDKTKVGYKELRKLYGKKNTTKSL
jgi:hypothetical protein